MATGRFSKETPYFIACVLLSLSVLIFYLAINSPVLSLCSSNRKHAVCSLDIMSVRCLTAATTAPATTESASARRDTPDSSARKVRSES